MNNIVKPLRSATDVLASSERTFGDGLLGKIFHDEDNGKSYKLVYCKNGDVTANEPVQLDVSEVNDYTVEAYAAAGMPVGIAVANMSSATYGFVQVCGKVSIKISTSASAGLLVHPSQATAGICLATTHNSITATQSTKVLGVLVSANATAGATRSVILRNLI